jgi:transcriptional regulator GlxA family with amidase domain
MADVFAKRGARGTMRKVSREHDFITQQKHVSEALTTYAYTLGVDPDHRPAEVRLMLRYIHTHLFDSKLTVEGIKASCGIKNHNVTTKFRQATGDGIREYVVGLRLDAAASVLSTMEVNIYILAEAVCYTEESFSRAFKERFGSSPLQYHRSKCIKEKPT